MQYNGTHVKTRFKTYRLHGICGANIKGQCFKGTKRTEVDIDYFKPSWRDSYIDVK